MPTSSNTRPDPALVRVSATEQLTAFRGSPPPASDKLLGDREMEGQMRSLPDVCFQLGHTRAEVAEVGSCVAIGFMRQGRYVMRIYRKTDAGWSAHTFALHVEVPQAQQLPRRRRSDGKSKAAAAAHPPVYAWRSTDPRPTGDTRRRRRNRHR